MVLPEKDKRQIAEQAESLVSNFKINLNTFVAKAY
jgi:hypothetical protein